MAGWKLRKDKTQAETPGVDSEIAAPPEPDALTAPEAEAHAEVVTLEPSDWLVNGWQTSSEDAPQTPALDPLPDFEADDALHFDDVGDAEPATALENQAFEGPAFPPEDPALTLVNYSEAPLTEPAAPDLALAAPSTAAPDLISFDPIASEPASLEPASLEPASLELPPPATSASLFAAPLVDLSGAHSAEAGETDELTQTLRMNREELAAAFPAPALGSDIPAVAPFVLDTPVASPAPDLVHRLIVQVGRLSAPFELTKDIMVIGRPDSALHYYPDVEIETDDAVSRRHAEVVKHEDGYYLSDLGSTNGTMLNGELLPPRAERRLTHGDRIRVGERTEIVFE